MAEFLISGLKLDEKLKSEIATLGSLVNSIVAVFDTLLDKSRSAPSLFSGDPQFSADAEIGARQKLVVDLVALYFRKLDLLHSSSRPVRATIDKAIRSLYGSELRTALPGGLRWTTWWRKNALHTVIIGLPAWLDLQAAGLPQYARHLKWLARVGELFGWLDDVADYELDRISGDANWLLFRHPTMTGQALIADCAKRIAAKRQRILKFWDSRNADSPVRDTFVVLAWQWVTEQ